MQLSLLQASAARAPTPDELVGSWCGGERWLRWAGGPEEATHVWLHLLADRRVVIAARRGEAERPHTVVGHWSLAGADLTLIVGDAVIRAPTTLDRGVLRWAGEVLVRLPIDVFAPAILAGESTRVAA